ncbi:hypothetical protein [Streptomyces mayteni]
MAHNPQAPQGPNQPDPAGSTQMFQAFVNDGGPARQQSTPAAPQSSGPRIGVILGVAVAITVLAVVAWLALG